jgi:hypothetical protein
MEATVGRGIRRIARLPGVVFVLSFMTAGAASAAQLPARACTPAGSLVPLSGLPEASGLAASRRTPGRLWTHNDSGQPVLFALDSRGTVTGQVRVAGARVDDWEAIAVGACDGGSCIYIGDIGDNDAKRKRITVYRVPEPQQASGATAMSDVFHATYPDGAHDAETLLVADGRLYVVTKGETGPIALYRFPQPLTAGTTMRLERVGEPVLPPGSDSWITDGAVSSDGQWIVLRSLSKLTFYRASDLLAGQWRAASTVAVTPLKEPQGEGVELLADDTVLLAGEGGGKKAPGTFVRFACAPAATMR